MSASNTNDASKSAAAQGGEFSSRVAGTGPETIHGHQPGRLTTEADKAGEFHAETLPAGTAPKESTFAPQTTQDVKTHTETTSAADTLSGSTSGDVHTGLGHPGQGMSSNEAHHDGGKGHGVSLMGVGAKGVASESDFGSNKADFSTPVSGATQKTTGEVPGRDEDRSM